MDSDAKTQYSGVLKEWADRMFDMVQDQLVRTESLSNQIHELEKKINELCSRVKVLEAKVDPMKKDVGEIFDKCNTMNTFINRVDVRSGLVGGLVGFVGGLIPVATTIIILWMTGRFGG